MLDHLESRLWADHHDAVTKSVSAIVHDLRAAFRALAAQRSAAPWQQGAPCTRG